ncbi:MAG: hypothetical protein SFT92_08030 [Rickettsiales bacterium]|nr:hypothetical protein [Rickettsiales bacterium]
MTNLTEGAKTLAILDGNKAVSVTLAAGETYHAMGALRLRFAERELRIEHDEEYAIWDDATISPQRRYKGGKRF